MMPIYFGLPIAVACGIAGGYAAGGLMKLAMRLFGTDEWGTETKNERAMRAAQEYMAR